MRYVILPGTMLTVLLVACESAMAQYPSTNPYGLSTNRPRASTPRRPTVSPYLNLLGGRGVGYEYYGRIRPQQEFRRTSAAMGRSIQELQAASQLQGKQLMDAEMGATGHTTSFMNHSMYFGVSTSGMGQTSVQRAARAPALQGSANR